MEKSLTITIGRQFGSGGRDIGLQLSERLGISFYDKEVLIEAAKDSGLDEAFFEKFDEKPTNSFWYSLLMNVRAGKIARDEYDMPLPERVFLAEFEAIQKIASEGSSVIVGRCADYVLRNQKNCINVFIYAPTENRIARIAERCQVERSKAEELIRQVDKHRSSYYNYYTTGKWGDVGSYHLCIDSSLCGVEGTAALIEDFIHRCGY